MDDKFFWFPLHSGDFLSKTSTLSCSEVGVYVQFLVHLTRFDRLPNKPLELKRIAKGEGVRTIKAALNLLAVDSKGYYSKEIEKHKKQSQANALKKSEAGREGARARWDGKNQIRMKGL